VPGSLGSIPAENAGASTTFGEEQEHFWFIPEVQNDGNLQEISDLDFILKAAARSPAIR
jgi:UDP-N-acetylenolpyruvoylglucosamine reductase